MGEGPNQFTWRALKHVRHQPYDLTHHEDTIHNLQKHRSGAISAPTRRHPTELTVLRGNAASAIPRSSWQAAPSWIPHRLGENSMTVASTGRMGQLTPIHPPAPNIHFASNPPQSRPRQPGKPLPAILGRNCCSCDQTDAFSLHHNELYQRSSVGGWGSCCSRVGGQLLFHPARPAAVGGRAGPPKTGPLATFAFSGRATLIWTLPAPESRLFDSGRAGSVAVVPPTNQRGN